jgi:hypothetical protein
MVEPVVTECGHRFCRKCIYCALRQLKRECPVCRRFIASHRVLKPWVKDGGSTDPGSTHDLTETVSRVVFEDGWICSTCTLQNSVSEARCTACSGRRAASMSKRGRPLLSPDMTRVDDSSTTSGVSDHCAQPSGHCGKAARIAQPAVKDSSLAADIPGASEGVCGEQGCIGAASTVLAQDVDDDNMVDGIVGVELVAVIPAECRTSTDYRSVQRKTSQTLDFQARMWGNGRLVSGASKGVRGKQKRCEHGREHKHCKECGGKSICKHGRQHHSCKECGGTSVCAHGRRRQICKECGGASICEHWRQRSRCKECGGKGICEHGRERNKCKECGGTSICEHGRQRYRCKECGGKGICEHGRERNTCRQCGGKSICEHGRQRCRCKECGGK